MHATLVAMDVSLYMTFTVEIGGCRSGISEDSSLMGCYAVSTGNWLPTFRISFSTPYSGSGGP